MVTDEYLDLHFGFELCAALLAQADDRNIHEHWKMTKAPFRIGS